jgi:glutamine synthetase
LQEIEVLWTDHQGHARGKRVEASGFLSRAEAGFSFCNATLAWDITGDVKDGLRVGSWETGWPDMFAVPDLSTFRRVPWREGVGQVLSDLVDHHGAPQVTSPRATLRRVIARLAALGYEAKVGVEFEFDLLGEDGQPLADGLEAYSLTKLSELDPVVTHLQRNLRGFVDVESSQSEYGDSQLEVNLRYSGALAAADQAARFKYAARELARQAGAGITFMAKPFGHLSGSSQHLHLSLWKDGEPALASDGPGESALALQVIGGLVEHLPGIVLYGAPTVNSYKRFEAGSFAPATATWGGDNRSVAVRSLVESPSSTRLELRTGAADANPYWAIASVLAAVVVALEDGSAAGPKGAGNQYEHGEPLAATLADAVAAARADQRIIDVLGEDAVFDYTALAQGEWEAFAGAVTQWDRDRYLHNV